MWLLKILNGRAKKALILNNLAYYEIVEVYIIISKVLPCMQVRSCSVKDSNSIHNCQSKVFF